MGNIGHRGEDMEVRTPLTTTIREGVRYSEGKEGRARKWEG